MGGCVSVSSQSNLSTWDAWAVERVGQCHADLGHAITFQQCVSCNLLPALQRGKRESSRARNHQPGGRGTDVRETLYYAIETLRNMSISSLSSLRFRVLTICVVRQSHVIRAATIAD